MPRLNKNQIEEDLFEFLEQEDITAEMQWYADIDVSKILDFRSEGRGALFIGNIYQTMQLAYNGNPNGIQAVLDVSTENDYHRNPDIIYLRVPFRDGQEVPAERFAQCMAFLKFCWEKNLAIQVNCAAGISRSTSIIVSFIYYAKLIPTITDMDRILDFVRMCRPIVRPAPSVFGSCRKWLRAGPMDSYTPPKYKLDNSVADTMLKLHVDPECEVRKSILADDDQERHLLKCSCKPSEVALIEVPKKDNTPRKIFDDF